MVNSRNPKGIPSKAKDLRYGYPAQAQIVAKKPTDIPTLDKNGELETYGSRKLLVFKRGRLPPCPRCNGYLITDADDTVSCLNCGEYWLNRPI